MRLWHYGLISYNAIVVSLFLVAGAHTIWQSLAVQYSRNYWVGMVYLQTYICMVEKWQCFRYSNCREGADGVLVNFLNDLTSLTLLCRTSMS